ncbi:hypothetical protein PLESTB_000215900 [Pleodorina starrii]|uniref:Carbohydrate binding module family 25 domain-containing protein n=1 Tax=Pleodorina starrii TaxID=330485 RepID=A0A9W6BC30_9CHLO|nr:hypothetical protein PLESTM_001541500 [Pleodorina starrii]GLC49406.1 hypothetical protein PLESTB_000215900 [Pleodorina starrii]GLC73332.1 hypothetical protein PLESTF_001364100 [Pleodorina starrii]
MHQGRSLKPCSPGWPSRHRFHPVTFRGDPAGPAPLRVAMPAAIAVESPAAGARPQAVDDAAAVQPTANRSSTATATVVLELPPATPPSSLTTTADSLPSADTLNVAPAAAAAATANNVVSAPSGITHAVPLAPATSETSPQDATTAASAAAAAAAAVVVTDADGGSASAGVEAAAAAAPPAPFTRVRSSPLAGGQLDVVQWREGRMLRIWTPPGYSLSDAAREPYPVLYLNDGQNLYGDMPTLSGQSWHAAEAAAGLIAGGALPPFVVVGIDHAGAMRSYDYLPYEPGTANGLRPDAAEWPGGGVDAYLRSVVDEILPYTERAYGVSSEPSLRCFGGSSFGGICALCAATRHPGVFGGLLVESPSLWFGEERMLREEMPAFPGPWPARMFLAMGTQEYSGIRSPPQPTFDSHLVALTHQLAALLESRGGLRRGEGLEVEVEEGATHTEAAWAGRLPRALGFLGRHWWRRTMARRRDQLYFTVPRKLRAGQPAVLFFNQARSAALADRPRDSIQMAYGFNVDWCVGGGTTHMMPAVGLTALRNEMAAAAQPPPPAAAAAAQDLPNIVGDATDPFDAAGASAWLQAAFTVPPEAYEMHLAFTDGAGGSWDNNAGCNFYVRVKMDLSAEQRSHPVELAMREGPAWGDVQDIAHKRSGSNYFTTPEVLVAGEPAVLYVNRRRVRGLETNPNLRLHFGFNGWQLAGQEACLKPTSLWRGEHIDWWSATMTIPPDATDLSFALTDGHGTWDNNHGNNYVCPVKSSRGAGGAVSRVEPRGVESVESMPHAAGTLHVLTLTKRQGGGAASRTNKWSEEKRLRVWTPPGFDPARPPPGGYPVLFMQDGQNMFEDWLAHQGVSWRVGYTASQLVSSGELPPFVVVAVDSAGAMRSLNYLPYPPGTGAGGFRGDAERWPGGGLEAYMSRLVEEIMPLVQQRFSVSSDPAKVAFGGGSFAGVSALYAALHYPHVFGCVLAESPSLWIAEGRFLQDMRMHRGMLPERLFLGCGTREYSATRDHEREDVDGLLLGYCQEAATILESQGMRGGRLRFLVEEGAGHHELAWQWRLTGAMRFLFSAWWDE